MPEHEYPAGVELVNDRYLSDVQMARAEALDRARSALELWTDPHHRNGATPSDLIGIAAYIIGAEDEGDDGDEEDPGPDPDPVPARPPSVDPEPTLYASGYSAGLLAGQSVSPGKSYAVGPGEHFRPAPHSARETYRVTPDGMQRVDANDQPVGPAEPFTSSAVRGVDTTVIPAVDHMTAGEAKRHLARATASALGVE